MKAALWLTAAVTAATVGLVFAGVLWAFKLLEDVVDGRADWVKDSA